MQLLARRADGQSQQFRMVGKTHFYADTALPTCKAKINQCLLQSISIGQVHPVGKPRHCPSGAVRMMASQVFDSSVKMMASTPGDRVIASPVEPTPWPWTRLNAPSVSPAEAITSASKVAEPGVSSEGLATTELPQASAGATFQENSSKCRFQGK